eukprot:363451-Chlamydomonas_euryale.AAC.19
MHGRKRQGTHGSRALRWVPAAGRTVLQPACGMCAAGRVVDKGEERMCLRLLGTRIALRAARCRCCAVATQAQPSTEKRATAKQLVDAWRAGRGGSDSRVAKALPRDDADAVLAALMLQGVLALDFGDYLLAAHSAGAACHPSTGISEALQQQAEAGGDRRHAHASTLAGQALKHSTYKQPFRPDIKHGTHKHPCGSNIEAWHVYKQPVRPDVKHGTHKHTFRTGVKHGTHKHPCASDIEAWHVQATC